VPNELTTADGRPSVKSCRWKLCAHPADFSLADDQIGAADLMSKGKMSKDNMYVESSVARLCIWKASEWKRIPLGIF
jgi:hypothetical protein